MIKAIKQFIATTRLDVFDLCYAACSQRFAGVHAKTPFWTQRSTLIRILIFVKHAIQAIARRHSQPWFGPTGRVVFFYFSANQRSCMTPVSSHVPGSLLACADVFNLRHKQRDIDFPLGLAYIAAIPFFPLAALKFFRATPHIRKTYRRFFDTYWLTYGFHLVATWWLRRLRPAALVVANDHSMWTRTVAHAARRLGVPTIYMQHACVTENFPPLAFDYALLDGQDALNKYIEAGSTETDTYLIGMPKFDPHIQNINTRTAVAAVGICLNKHDPLDRVRQACQAIVDQFPQLKVIMRPHPGDPRQAQWSAIAKEFNLDFSYSAEQGPFNFLQSVDAVIAGESSILLEAALINVAPIYYDFPEYDHDWYGFSRNALATLINKTDQLVDHLQKLTQDKPNVRTLARRYCTTVDTPLEGHSSELAADLIRSIIKSQPLSNDRWAALHTSAPFPAYVPVAPQQAAPDPVIVQTTPQNISQNTTRQTS